MLTSEEEVRQDLASSPIPMVIGVTGHRDLRAEDTARLEDEVAKIFKELQTKYPDTPLLLLSSLAEGADRLVARVALEHGARLIVPLPLSREVYEKDFSTPGSRNEFNRLLDRAERWFELPLMAGSTPEVVQNQGPDRDRQYAQTGAYIARSSQILIALWDGVESESAGGTAQIVKFKRDRIPEPYGSPPDVLHIADSGPVYHIVTPRRKNPHPIGDPFSRKDADSLTNSYARVLARVNTFNRDARRLSPRLAEDIKRNRAYVIPEGDLSSLPGTARAILEQYALADTLAMYFQRLRRRTMIALFSIAMMSVLSFEVYAHLLSKWWVLALYPASLGSAFLLYFWARRQDCQNKHLDYRALAEGMRVQLFWHLAGLSDDVADHYLRKQRSEIEWIRSAIRIWNATVGMVSAGTAPGNGASTAPDQAMSIERFVVPRWVEDQRGFFITATDLNQRKLHRHDRTARRLFGYGLALAALVVILDLAFPKDSGYSRWHPFLVVIMGTSPAIAAAMIGYAEKMAFAPQAKRYEWMSALFTRASKKLRSLLAEARVSDAQQLIRELGREALEENGDWVMTHRERPLGVPMGG